MKSKNQKTKKVTTKKKASSVKKDIMYTDGKSHAVDEKSKLRDLEEVLNPLASHNPFKAKSREQFDGRMADMTLPELQSLAVEVGVFPSGNRTTLKNKLKKEFANVVFAGKGRVMQTEKPILDVSKLSEEDKKYFNIV